MNSIGSNAKEQLLSIVQRIERMEDEKASIAEGIRDIYTEAKGNGFDVKTVRKIIALRKKDASTLSEEEALLDTYKHALGMQTSFNFDDATQ